MRSTVGILLLSSALSAVGPVTANSQGLRVGVKGGVNLATWGGSDVSLFETACGCNNTTRTGVAVGGFVSFDLSRIVRLQPELYYMGKGTKIELAGVAASINVSYLELPVLLVVAPRVQGTIHPSFFGGGALGVKVGCSISGGGASVSCSNASFPTKSLDYGLVFGGGLGFALGKGEALIDGRYNLGLAKVLDTNPTLSLSHRGLAILAGYSFRVGR
ncbi:MAG TPA: porin family protein [Gemmatimonadales bacterium]